MKKYLMFHVVFLSASTIFVFLCSCNNKHVNITAMKKTLKTANAPAPIGPYSQAVFFANTLYVSGNIAINPQTGILENTDIKTETNRVMQNIKAILNAAGMDFSDVLKTTVFLKDMNDFAKVNEVYGMYFRDNYPARETVEVSRLPKDANVEISVIAAK